MAIGSEAKACTVVLHDDSTSNEDVLCGADVVPAGRVAYLVAPGAKPLCVENRTLGANAGEVSIHISLAKLFGFENRMRASAHVVDDVEAATATHVEILLREQHLSRADMWKIREQVDASVLYRTQRLNYLGSSTASVEALYVAGSEVQSALVSHPQTKLIFRSASARFTILIQVSKEMLQDWAGTDLMHERLTNGFLPELFHCWDQLKARHQVTVVLFGRAAAPVPLRESRNHSSNSISSDFFRVMTLDLASSNWRLLLRKLKEAFNNLQSPQQVTLAAKGNMLEAIQLAALDLANVNIDQHLASTGTSIIAITAGAGLFEADYVKLKALTGLLTGSNTGVDIVSLSPQPLHPAPLFQYGYDGRTEYALPHWADISYWAPFDDSFDYCWPMPTAANDISRIEIPHIILGDARAEYISRQEAFHAFDESAFSTSSAMATFEIKSGQTGHKSVVEANGVSMNVDVHDKAPVVDETDSPPPTKASEGSGSGGMRSRSGSTSNVRPGKKATSLRHPSLLTSRAISLGPRGIAPTQSVASTGLSAHHVQHEKETAPAPTFLTNDARSGLSKQFKDSLGRIPSSQPIPVSAALASGKSAHPTNPNIANTPSTDDTRDPASIIEDAVLESVARTSKDGLDSSSTTPSVQSTNKFIDKSSVASDVMDASFPWLTLLNPCNPRKENMRIAGEHRQWQNVFPRTVSSDEFKWESMRNPAALPLLREGRPSLTELETLYKKKIRRLVSSATSKSQTAQQAMAQMINMRLNTGFQVVPSRNHWQSYEQVSLEFADRILLSLGTQYHEIQRLSESEIQITEYEKLVASEDDPRSFMGSIEYVTDIQSNIAHTGQRVSFDWPHQYDLPDWLVIDDQCMNGTEFTDLGSCRIRFVLIPAEAPRSDKQSLPGAKELTDEEYRLEGIQKLTQMWQRYRYFTNEDQRHQTSMVKPKISGSLERDPNPLAIEYQTRDTSTVVGAYGLNFSRPGESEPLAKLFSESEQYHSSNFDVARLAKQMQDLPPNGVEFKDRRWFTRLHLKCFRGDEMTNWLLRVFKDLQTREDAVVLGNQLMDRDVFTHVRGKHEFRDGNYFYQIRAVYRTTDYPDTAGFFGRPVGRSVASTPMPDQRQSPASRPMNMDSDSISKGAPTPTLAPVERKEKKEILLSQRLQYNVDPGRKSTQTEILNIHYDRIHNPDNCYNILLDWNDTTAKLIRDSVVRWAALVESYGLRLVQLPTKEASKLGEQHPFEQVISIKLAVTPPDRAPETPHLDSQASSPRTIGDQEGFHKAILRRLDFVLDTEAAHNFPDNVDVTYSWGKPDYEYTQFIHKSGTMLAQIVNGVKTDFLLLSNRLASNFTTGTARRAETPSMESIAQRVISLCRNEKALIAIYDELNKPKISALSPLANAMGADQDVPPIELPPRLNHRTLLRNA